MAKGGRYLLFIWKTSGYELAEREGDPPAQGTEVEESDSRYLVSKVGPSPLPGDKRACAYLSAI